MANSRRQAAPPITPAKLGLIAVLSVVLIAVLAGQFAKDNQPAAPPIPRRRTAQVSPTPNAAPKAPTPPVARTIWPSMSVDQVARIDPFRLPDALRKPETTVDQPAQQSLAETEPALRLRRREDFFRQLQQVGVSMVVMGDRTKVAQVGEYRFQEGDVIEGMRVVSIRANGVTLLPELEAIRPSDKSSSPRAIKRLPPPFVESGTVTPGNAGMP